MPGIFALSIHPDRYQSDFLQDLFLGTFYHQHLGEAYAGLSTCNGGKFQIRTHRGLFRATFSHDLEGLEGTHGIGYCGSVREPHFSDSRLGEFSCCFSGNVTNLAQLVQRFKDAGDSFTRGDDIEVISKLLAKGETVVEGIRGMTAEIQGAFSLLILTRQGVYAVRCPSGRWPLVIGTKDGAAAVATESGGFTNLGFKRVRDVEPGEIVLLKDGEWQSVGSVAGAGVQVCSFYWVYTGFPNNIFEDVPDSLVRKRLGAALARRDIEQGFVPDVVIPVPDSGRFHAIGYHQEFCRQMMKGRISKMPVYDELLMKYPYSGRSFIPRDQKLRDREARIKQLPTGEDCSGKVIAVCDDSIVRGTQTQTQLVPKLRRTGAKEIHFRISYPELRSHCRWGKTTKKGEILAPRIPDIQERARYLGVESIRYNNIQDLAEAIGHPLEKLCVDCALDLRDSER
ncbi:MAG: amidophosphoribosyltransferase [Bryobacteraceae bacterium]